MKTVSVKGKQRLIKHPMRSDIEVIIAKHFAPSIAQNFKIELEANIYNWKDNDKFERTQGIRNQIRDNTFIAEVHYKEGENVEYICDIRGDMSKKVAEYYLLRNITAKVQAGKIGSDWIENSGMISKTILDA